MSTPTIFHKLKNSTLFHNISALYGVHFVNYLLPLITVPYLTRVLGPSAWGLLAFTLAYGQYLNLIIEYGFSLSATREVAKFRENKEKLSELLAGVLGAKLILIFFSLIITLTLRFSISTFKEAPILLWLGFTWAITQSLNPLWYFQGLEKMRVTASIDIISKIISTIGIFIFIHAPSQFTIVLVLQIISSVFSSVMALIIAYKQVSFRFPNMTSAWGALKLGWTMFLFKSAVSFYTVGNTFILGLFAEPQYVGYYAGAEKISKALLGLLNPVSQAFYPRISYLVQQSRNSAAQLVITSLKIMGSGGLLMSIVAFFFSPLLVKLLLGSNFKPAIDSLRILSLLPTLIALSNVLGIQWMIPLGLDRPFNWIIIIAGIINITLAITLAPKYLQNGMAISVVISELFVTGGICYILKLKKTYPTYFLKKDTK